MSTLKQHPTIKTMAAILGSGLNIKSYGLIQFAYTNEENIRNV
ncbi:hypothetical protein [Fructilactobacillus florum]|nr:hypothetical protein [Fructilactobacillus florum]